MRTPPETHHVWLWIAVIATGWTAAAGTLGVVVGRLARERDAHF